MRKGKVKQRLDFRGYGFIDTEEYNQDIFVHASDILGNSSLTEGDEVEFEVESTYKDPKTVNVKPVSE